MIYWFKQLPASTVDLSPWRRFIHYDFFHDHFMKFVYLLQVIVFCIPFIFRLSFYPFSLIGLIVIGIITFIVHELIHMVFIYRHGNISLTFSNMFFWLHTDAILTKGRFLSFMSGPFIALSLIPLVLSIFTQGNLQLCFLFIGWINIIFSAADIINSIIILCKPKHAKFYRGYYMD